MKQHEDMIAVRFRLEGTLYIQMLVSAVTGMFFACHRIGDRQVFIILYSRRPRHEVNPVD
jgi:hypothetical protein